MSIRIERRYPRHGKQEEPIASAKGYELAAPGAGNTSGAATFVQTLAEVAALVRRGYLLRMGAPGLRPSLISGKSLRIIEEGSAPAGDVTAPASPPRNPSWTRDELILAFDLYLTSPAKSWDEKDREVLELSQTLRAMAAALGTSTYRNPNGVAMKLLNLRSLNPDIPGGLPGTGRRDREVWDEFHADRQRLAAEADRIRKALAPPLPAKPRAFIFPDKGSPEGQEILRLHKDRERDSGLAKRKKASVLQNGGHLSCEACGFDFAACYGQHGSGFIEVHHNNFVHAMKEGDVTMLADLSLLCANCHRMIHRRWPWRTVEELRVMLAEARQAAAR